jgi:hypothetical protein
MQTEEKEEPPAPQRKRARDRGAGGSQVDRVRSQPRGAKIPNRKRSTSSHQTKSLENDKGTKRSAPTRNVHPAAESPTLVTPPPSPRRPPCASSSPKRAGQNTLPPPKSPLRLTLRRKASKPVKTTKSQMIIEKVEEKYDEDGSLHRTTVTRIRNSDGSWRTEKHKEYLIPTSPRYRPKPEKNAKASPTQSHEKSLMVRGSRTKD